MERERFLQLPVGEIAALVRERRPALSCGFPLNGSRRWYALEQAAGRAPRTEPVDAYTAYIETSLRRQIAVHRMLYAHGVHTIVYPVFGGELLTRGEAYSRALLAALEHIARHPALRAFYAELDVQVRVYGDYARPLTELGRESLIAQFDAVMQATAGHRTCRLLYGLWGEDAAEASARCSARFFEREGRPPRRAELVREIYGVELGWLDLYVGFERPTVFDVPLLLGPDTALYFTAAPSLGLTERALRMILHDLLFVRGVPDPDALRLDAAQLARLGAYYAAHADAVAGVGRIDPELGVWRPLEW